MILDTKKNSFNNEKNNFDTKMNSIKNNAQIVDEANLSPFIEDGIIKFNSYELLNGYNEIINKITK